MQTADEIRKKAWRIANLITGLGISKIRAKKMLNYRVRASLWEFFEANCLVRENFDKFKADVLSRLTELETYVDD